MDAFLKALDTNRDGEVSETEWKAAETALRPLDQNDYELLRPTELIARIMYPGSHGGVMLTSPTSTKKLPPLLATLPGTRLPIHPSEPLILPIRTVGFPADTNRDGVLDASELTNLPKSPDRVSLTLRLGNRPNETSDTSLSPAEPKGMRLVSYTVASSLIDDFGAARKSASERFAAANANGDGHVDATEVKNAGYAPLRDHFAFADRNGDQRLAKTEWERYLALRERLVTTQTTILDHGRGLWEALDGDSDGGLSVRELRGTWSRLAALGCLSDGTLDAKKLPQSIRMIASRGHPQSLLRMPVRSGPEWFLAMDRNRNGDVSRREFIGTDDAFSKLDADHDGLISNTEATRTGTR